MSTDPRTRLEKLGINPSLGPAAICEFCDWTAQHLSHPTSNKQVIEIATFLRERCMAHMREAHPEKLEGGNVKS
jgi:hypothetical protein